MTTIDIKDLGNTKPNDKKQELGLYDEHCKTECCNQRSEWYQLQVCNTSLALGCGYNEKYKNKSSSPSKARNQ